MVLFFIITVDTQTNVLYSKTDEFKWLYHAIMIMK